MLNIQNFDNELDWTKAIADLTLNKLKASIGLNDQAIWQLAGGNTPLIVYSYIAANYAQYIDWSKVILILGDERWVNDDNPLSNYGLIKRSLIDRLSLKESQLIRPRYNSDKEDELETFNADLIKLTTIRQNLDIDVSWLGIGSDGHTLSLFPGKSLNSQTLASLVTDSPKPPADRITLTKSAVAHAKQTIVLASGADKQPIISRISQTDINLPIVQVLIEIAKNGGQINVMFT